MSILLEVKRLGSLDRIEAIAANELGLQYPEKQRWLFLSGKLLAGKVSMAKGTTSIYIYVEDFWLFFSFGLPFGCFSIQAWMGNLSWRRSCSRSMGQWNRSIPTCSSREHLLIVGNLLAGSATVETVMALHR